MTNALLFSSNKSIKANKTTIMRFGQYKDMSIAEIMETDASYLVWVAEKEIMLFDAWLLDEIYEAVDEQHTEYLQDKYDDAVYESSDDPGSPRY